MWMWMWLMGVFLPGDRVSTTSATTTRPSTLRRWTNWRRKAWSWRTTTSSPSARRHAASCSPAGTEAFEYFVFPSFTSVFVVFLSAALIQFEHSYLFISIWLVYCWLSAVFWIQRFQFTDVKQRKIAIYPILEAFLLKMGLKSIFWSSQLSLKWLID